MNVPDHDPDPNQFDSPGSGSPLAIPYGSVSINLEMLTKKLNLQVFFTLILIPSFQ